MSHPQAQPTLRADLADARWAELEHWTLEACILRAEGREQDAVRILQDRMPALIRDWSVQSRLSKPEIQTRLRRMMAEKQDFITRGLAQRRLITSALLAETQENPASLPPALARRAASAASTPVALRRHIPLDDIPGMLDGLAEAEREARREALWPLRSPATLAAAAL